MRRTNEDDRTAVETFDGVQQFPKNLRHRHHVGGRVNGRAAEQREDGRKEGRKEG